MGQERLSNSEFLGQLTQLHHAQSSSTSGSIYLTQKRWTHGEDSEVSMSSPAEESSLLGLVAKFSSVYPSLAKQGNSDTFPVLFRATDGKSTNKRDSRIKISTVVSPQDLDAFVEKYVEVCRAGMSDGLRKRDRKKKEKKRKAKAKKAQAKEKETQK